MDLAVPIHYIWWKPACSHYSVPSPKPDGRGVLAEMARAGRVTPATEQCLSDHISVRVLVQTFPPEVGDAGVAATGEGSIGVVSCRQGWWSAAAWRSSTTPPMRR